MPEEGLNPVVFPEAASQAWEWFIRLAAKRPQAMSGIAPIPESEIGWFFRNRGIVPESWELDAIEALDRLALKSAGEDGD